MKIDQSLYSLVAKYVHGQISLSDVEDWISSREQLWASYPKDSPESLVTASMMLALYELGEGHRDEESVLEIAESLLKELEPQPSRSL